MDQKTGPLPPVTIGEYVLDESNARLTRDGAPLDVPPKAFAVLCHLTRHAQRLVTKDDLLDAVWGHRHVSESVLKTTINLLRTQLGDDPRAPRYIETANRRGYRFVATVTSVRADSPASVTSARAVAEPAGDELPTVLAVDDEPELLAMLADYLGARGFRVLTASNTRDARSILGSNKVGLVLLDITLPGEDGLSLARHLREHQGPPVILVTALGTVLDRIVGLEVGADDYVTKPFEMRELLARIKNVLRRTGA
jgi:DNA-binding response OmpR family regulator